MKNELPDCCITFKKQKMKERIMIIEEKSFGFVVMNLTHKAQQLIPYDKLLKRVKWGMYEIVNACMIPVK